MRSPSVCSYISSQNNKDNIVSGFFFLSGYSGTGTVLTARYMLVHLNQGGPAITAHGSLNLKQEIHIQIQT
jgi:hypothetical protein